MIVIIEMPMTLVDRLPIPNLKVYTTGSVCLLSIAVYYALGVTSDPNWRVNATLQRQAAMAEEGDVIVPQEPVFLANDTRNFTEQLVEVMTFMIQEPLCMWTLINLAYCLLVLFGFLIQRVVFGSLRVAEAQRVKDKFWNYVFYKFIFVFGVINVQYMDEVMLWCSWFTLVGFLHLLGQLCKDRFEYLSSSPNASRWALARLMCLLAGIAVAAGALLAAAVVWGLPAGRDTFAFMAAECVLVLVAVLHVGARYVLQRYDVDVAGPVAYYTHLIFDGSSLCVELLHVVHMVAFGRLLVSLASLVLLLQLRHLLHELQARLRKHRLYTSLHNHMSRNYPMASKEEVEKNQDNCAICWEPMKEARKLPCSHLFHNSCLCQWVQQDASCPTCRRALHAQPSAAARATPATPATPAAAATPAAPATPATPAHAATPTDANHLFHFDGSRYVSWLPSFSVEVTRVRLEPRRAPSLTSLAPLAPVAPFAPVAPMVPINPVEFAQLDHLARQLQQMFPQFPLSALAADLAGTRSADLTADNILGGRLRPPSATPATTPTPPSATPTAPTATPTTPAATPTAEVPALIAETVTPETEILTQSTILQSTSESHDNSESSPLNMKFSGSASERQVMLQRRKEMLVASAKKRYLEKTAKRPAAGHS